MKYLLIYWLLANPSGYAPTSTAEFNDQASCAAALKAIAQTWSFAGAPGVCVAKGAESPAPAPSDAVPAPSAPQSPGGGKCPAGSSRPTC